MVHGGSGARWHRIQMAYADILQGYTVYGHSVGHPQGIHTWFRMVGYMAMDHRQPWYQGVTNADLQQLGHEPCAQHCGTHKNERRRPLSALCCSAANVMLVLLSSMDKTRLRRVMASCICRQLHVFVVFATSVLSPRQWMHGNGKGGGGMPCGGIGYKERGVKNSGLHNFEFAAFD